MSGVSRKQRNEASERACVECRRRKTRCIFTTGSNACSYCAKTGKDCTLGDRPARTPLTRRNLDAAESRCRHLESILLAKTRQVSQQLERPQTSVPSSLPPILGRRISNQNQAEAETEHNSDPPSCRSNDWQEPPSLEDEVEQDGMASLDVPSKNSGYLGLSSGSSLLQSLSSYLPARKATTISQRAQNELESPASASSQNQRFSIKISSSISISLAHDHFVSAYFLGYNSSFPIIYEDSFRKQCLRKSQIPSHDAWHVTYFMVLAIGEWVSGCVTEHQSLYYEAARSRLTFDILESGSLGTVQAFLLLGNFLQKRDRPNTAYNFIGIAYRMALGLGLHRELPAGHGINFAGLQQRRLLFWILYSFDSGLSLTTGRPNLVSDTFIDIRKPINIDDSLILDSEIELEEVDYPTTYSAIIAQARLAVIANKVYNNFLSVRPCSDIEDLVATMELTIRNWRGSLPSYFFSSNVPQWFLGPREMVLWKEANLQIVLLLASQRRHVETHDKLSIGAKCETVATVTILDISRFCLENSGLIHTGLSWYAVYFLLHALLALGLQRIVSDRQNLSRKPTRRRASQSTSLESTLLVAEKCLKALGHDNKAALRTIQILDRIKESLDQSTAEVEANNNVTQSQPPQTRPKGLTNGQQDMTQSVQQNEEIHSNLSSTPPSDETQAVPIENMFSQTSPDDLLAQSMSNDWVTMTDPSLHCFFDNGLLDFDNFFQGIQGFPNVAESENFAYLTSNMEPIRVPEQNQFNPENGD